MAGGLLALVTTTRLLGNPLAEKCSINIMVLLLAAGLVLLLAVGHGPTVSWTVTLRTSHGILVHEADGICSCWVRVAPADLREAGFVGNGLGAILCPQQLPPMLLLLLLLPCLLLPSDPAD